MAVNGLKVRRSGLNEKAHNIHKIWLNVAVCYEVYSGANTGSSYKIIVNKKK